MASKERNPDKERKLKIRTRLVKVRVGGVMDRPMANCGRQLLISRIVGSLVHPSIGNVAALLQSQIWRIEILAMISLARS